MRFSNQVYFVIFVLRRFLNDWKLLFYLGIASFCLKKIIKIYKHLKKRIEDFGLKDFYKTFIT